MVMLEKNIQNLEFDVFWVKSGHIAIRWYNGCEIVFKQPFYQVHSLFKELNNNVVKNRTLISPVLLNLNKHVLNLQVKNGWAMHLVNRIV